MRQDAKKRVFNKNLSTKLKQSIKKAHENPTPELVNKTFSLIDKAAKKGLIHKNTANRKKSLLSKKTSAKSKTMVKSKAKNKN